MGFDRLRSAFGKILLAGAVMGIACTIGLAMVDGLALTGKIQSALAVYLLVPGGAGLYFSVLYLLKFEELQRLSAILRRILGRSN